MTGNGISIIFLLLLGIKVSAQESGVAAGMKEPVYVYCNWSAYDELSDSVRLTEGLAMRELDEIVRLKKQGVRFDYYLMDAFWFDPDGGYRTWRKNDWPDGPGRWLEACKANNLIPGLWFSTNRMMKGHLNSIPEWENSRTSDNHFCLFEGDYLKHLMETFQMYADKGVKQGKKEIPLRIEYDKMIWSGISWAAGEVEAGNINPGKPLEITCTSKEGEAQYFKIEVYGVL
ncbi:MAG: hypothetical protein LBK07_06665, partial [Tannerella sp.]|nr:hypothetical protein [Tannerella sp.]